ncbi:hypothetical protein [Paraburkholderia sediminicola]|uniref:hypothetical protein n=1 Tax=Paraburkholderia sediminicola TaxID=458836 RepID=UPI0038B9C42D
MTKPYIFNYSETLTKSSAELANVSRLDLSTVQTATVEPADDDALWFVHSTVVTRSTEPADDDEFRFASTVVTESAEPADRDEMHLDSTFVSKTTEPTDEDFIHPAFLGLVV